jgi:hypothetical protein
MRRCIPPAAFICQSATSSSCIHLSVCNKFELHSFVSLQQVRAAWDLQLSRRFSAFATHPRTASVHFAAHLPCHVFSPVQCRLRAIQPTCQLWPQQERSRSLCMEHAMCATCAHAPTHPPTQPATHNMTSLALLLRLHRTIVATPFRGGRGEEIDTESFAQCIRFMKRAGVDGVTITGVLGESNRLLDAERVRDATHAHTSLMCIRLHSTHSLHCPSRTHFAR